jgi:hypothetical protein
MDKEKAIPAHETGMSANGTSRKTPHKQYQVTPAADSLVRMYTGRLTHHKRPAITREGFMNHLRTVVRHKELVMIGCFRVGLYRQGLLHDLSKFAPTEFLVGARYFQGNRSPNNAEREDIGYSSSWLHHKGRNRHHFEYWTDYSMKTKKLMPVPMPDEYIYEMFCDRVAASKIYKKNDYNDRCPLEYFLNGKNTRLIDPTTEEKLEHLLTILAEKGEEAAFEHIRNCRKNRR